MLVLSRRIGEAIVIGETKIEVTDLDPTTARLKFERRQQDGAVHTTHATVKQRESVELAEEQSTIIIVEIREVHSVFKVRLGIEAPMPTHVFRAERTA